MDRVDIPAVILSVKHSSSLKFVVFVARSLSSLILSFPNRTNYHDESIFNTNEGQKWAWATGDKPIIQPKTKEAGITVSDFIEHGGGFL